MISLLSDWLVQPELLCLLAVCGAVAGLLAGMMGIGGGVVLVPALLAIYQHMGIDPGVAMPSALGTSLSTIIFTGMVSVRAHIKRDNVDYMVVRLWLVPVGLGAILGSTVAKSLKSDWLIGGFALFLLLVAAQMALGRIERVVREGLPPHPWRAMIGILIGLVSAIMGIGGGTISVPAMTLCGFPVKRAIGTAAALGLVIAIPGSIAYAVHGWGLTGLPPGSVGYVNLVGLMLITPFSMLAAPYGAKLVHILPALLLKRLFALFLVIMAIRMLVRLLS